jgi:subtilase family serine protease
MTLQQLKYEIIKGETAFIIDLHTDANSTIAEINENINEMISEVNSCQTPEELVYMFMEQGYTEEMAYSHLFKYLVEN